MSDNNWKFQEAKNKLSELVDRTLSDGAQIITRHGKKTIVVIPFNEYNRITHPKGCLSEFLLTSPLAGLELQFEGDHFLSSGVHVVNPWE
jgi:prevent-host-death family protein